MNLTLLIMFLGYALGAMIMAYIVGRFTYRPSIFHDLGWVLVMWWPVALIALPFITVGALGYGAYKMGEMHQSGLPLIGSGQAWKQLQARNKELEEELLGHAD